MTVTGARVRLTEAGWDTDLAYEVIAEPLRPLEDHEVLVRVEACGVCHRDLIDRAGRFPFQTYPITPGHEAAVVVVAVGAAVPVAQRLPSAEAELAGFAITRERIEHCAANAAATLSPLDDARGSADYRQAMVRVQLLRSLGDAFGLERT
jgi:D-arabinose 1-dehydrogenase-like Zn-dependent alcohol dehydrogenase